MGYRSAILLCYSWPKSNSVTCCMKLSKFNSFQVTSDFTHYGSYQKHQKVAITNLAIGIDSQVTHNMVAMEKVAV